MIAMIVGRLHVCAPNRDVIAAIRAALRPDVRNGAKYRAERKALYREGIRIHEQNFILYAAVMSGKL